MIKYAVFLHGIGKRMLDFKKVYVSILMGALVEFRTQGDENLTSGQILAIFCSVLRCICVISDVILYSHAKYRHDVQIYIANNINPNVLQTPFNGNSHFSVLPRKLKEKK